MARDGKSQPPGECAFAPVIPDTALPDFVLNRDLDAETAIRWPRGDADAW